MKTLILLRHAQSGPGTPDRERSLDNTGLDEAARVGRLLAEAAPRPGLALVSDARRARQTFAALAAWPEPVRAAVEPRLYAASRDAILHLIRAIPDGESCVLVVGHNPGLGEAARLLAQDGPARDMAALGLRFPTAAAAVIGCPVANWSETGAGGRLLALLLGGA